MTRKEPVTLRSDDGLVCHALAVRYDEVHKDGKTFRDVAILTRDGKNLIDINRTVIEQKK